MQRIGQMYRSQDKTQEVQTLVDGLFTSKANQAKLATALASIATHEQTITQNYLNVISTGGQTMV